MCRDLEDWYSPYVKTAEEIKVDKDSGIKVIGPNTSNRQISVWHFGDDEKMAQHFAEGLARDTQETVLVVRMIGKWTPLKPVHYTESK
jgi:hypothetical protein